MEQAASFTLNDRSWPHIKPGYRGIYKYLSRLLWSLLRACSAASRLALCLAPDIFIINGFGASGISHQEESLAYCEVVLSGHMLPGYAPWVRDLQSHVDMKLIAFSSRRQLKSCIISWENGTTAG